MDELALFAGAGGGILGGQLLGWRTRCAVEVDAYCRNLLLARQRDGMLPRFPIWDDVRTFDGNLWRGHIDIITGGFPCQDISCAGKGAGITGERSGLWFHMARIVGEVRPGFVFVENSPVLTARGLGSVLGDLAAMGYNAEWGVLGADDAGAPHHRKRIWILAYTESGQNDERKRRYMGQEETVGEGQYTSAIACGSDVAYAQSKHLWSGFCQAGTKSDGSKPSNSGGVVSHTEESGLERSVAAGDICATGCTPEYGSGRWEVDWWAVEPDVGRMADRVAHRMDRLKAIGNGQVPAVVRLAFIELMNRIRKE